MQTHLVFAAEQRLNHEFLLAAMAMKAVHRMHRPGERTEDTALRVFDILAKGKPMDLPLENTIGDAPCKAQTAHVVSQGRRNTEM